MELDEHSVAASVPVVRARGETMPRAILTMLAIEVNTRPEIRHGVRYMQIIPVATRFPPQYPS